MFKIAIITTSLILPFLAATVAPAQADHKMRGRWIERQLFDSFFDDDSYDPRFDGRFIDDEEEEIIVVPRRKRLAREAYIDELYEDDFDEPPVKRVKPKVQMKTVVKTPAKPVTKVAAKPLVKATPKPKLVQVAAVSKPALKPVRKSSVAAAPMPKPVAKAPVMAAKPALVATPKQARLVLPPDDRPSVVAPKTPRVVPAAPISTTTITCEKANEIVAGYGFTAVSPLLCVGKTYRFKAVRDGKTFEVNLSAASGELTEVKKL